MKSDTPGFDKEFAGRLQGLEGEYILAGCSRERLFHLAGEIRDAFAAPVSGRPGRRACVCSDRKEIIMAAILASLVGGPELIIPHALSEPVIGEVLKSHDCLLVAEAGGESPFPRQTVFLEGAKRPLSPPSLPPDPDRTLLSLFTGGSTARPKIWRKTARNLFGEALHLVDRFGITDDDLVLATVPPRHIYGLLFAVLVPFLSGARVIGGTAAFPGEIISAANRYSATVLVSVPIHYRVLTAADFRMPSLRAAFSSAGALAKEDADYFYGRTGIAVSEIYGSTETGGVATRRPALGEEVLTPFENVNFRIEKGVLKIKSDFISPDLPKDAKGFFTTSDRVRREGGGFVLLGRVDDIVKVAGKRVDLVEIQQAIRKAAGVQDARVFAVRSANGRQNEIAAIVAGGVEEAALRAGLGRVLEPHCLPRRIRIVRRLPSLPTGKLDRDQIEKIFRQE